MPEQEPERSVAAALFVVTDWRPGEDARTRHVERVCRWAGVSTEEAPERIFAAIVERWRRTEGRWG